MNINKEKLIAGIFEMIAQYEMFHNHTKSEATHSRAMLIGKIQSLKQLLSNIKEGDYNDTFILVNSDDEEIS